MGSDAVRTKSPAVQAFGNELRKSIQDDRRIDPGECGAHRGVITYAHASGRGKLALCPRCETRPDALWRESVTLGGRLS